MQIWLLALLVLVRSFALRKRKSTNNLSIVYKSMISNNNTSIMAEAIRPELICFVGNMLTKTTMEKFEKLLITPMK